MIPAIRQLYSAAAFVMAVVPIGCAVSTGGLGDEPDGAPGTGGIDECPVGLTDQAGWPASSSSATSCSRPCGPDNLGSQICRQTDLASCKKQSGCVCLSDPCVACADCGFVSLPDCYVPTNTSSPPACEDEVSKGKACAPACGQLLCLRKDGRTGCICNAKGKYACGDWGASGWK
jgi:hypothetical protein